MGYVRSEQERKAAVDRLQLNKEKCERYNFFAEDVHQHIDISIDVIQNERSEEWIYEKYPSCDEFGNEDTKAHAKWSSAISAREYLAGDIDIGFLLYPER